MAIQDLGYYGAMFLGPQPGLPFLTTSANNAVLDAAGESIAMIGYINLEGGSGSKTISSAGGKIHWRANIVTFANASTNIRIGVQDVSAGIEDTTYDVYADLVPGVETITQNALNTSTMESGTKTISHGDLVAIVIEMTARGGVDSIAAVYNTSSSSTALAHPYITIDSGSGPTRTSGGPCVTIEFDDGTVGWLGNWFATAGGSITGQFQTFNSGSTPDERALIFTVPGPIKIIGGYAFITSLANTDDMELILYSDPLGTPVAERTFTLDADNAAANANQISAFFSSPFTTTANTAYALAVRPTTANSINTFDYEYGDQKLMRPTALGTDWYLGTRTNQTGAFSTTTTTIPNYGLFVSAIDDGASTGGGGQRIIGG